MKRKGVKICGAAEVVHRGSLQPQMPIAEKWGRQNKGLHGNCEYVTLHGKGELIQQMDLRLLIG